MAQVKKKNGFVTGWVFSICCGLVLLSFVDVRLAAAGNNKVGILDTAKILLQSQYANQLRVRFEALMKDQREALAKKKAAVEKQQKRVEAVKAAGKSDETIKKEEYQLDRDVRELKLMKEDFDKELKETDSAFQKKLKERIQVVLNQFIAATDYCIIIEKYKVVTYCDSADITDEIVKRLDDYRD